AASAAAHGVRRPHDDGIPHLAGKSQRLFDAVNDRALRHGFADLFHGEFEKLAVFGRLDRRERRAEEPHPKAVQYPCLGQCHGQIEAGLAPQGGKQPIGPLAFDHFGGELEGEGFEVHFVGNMGIRHDGCRVGVDEDDLDPLFLQGFARLGARVIKLRSLADDDRARPDHQHPLQLALTWHSDAHSSHTSSSRRNASSISSSLTVSGGSKRSTLSPMTLTNNPFSRHPFRKRLPGTLSSTPSINPKPRTSPKTLGCRSAKPLSPFQRRWAAWGTRSSTPSLKRTSRTAKAARVARKLPPKVEAWLPGSNPFAASSVASIAPMGTPPPKPLAKVQMSALTPYCSAAKNVPVRPTPVCTSSRMSSNPCWSQRARTPWRYSGVQG